MQMTVTAPPTENKFDKLNIYPDDHARFKVLAAQYGVTMADLFTQVVTSLEMDAAGRTPEKEPQP